MTSMTTLFYQMPSRDGAIVPAGVNLEDRLPPNEYLEYYGPDFRLQPSVPQDKPNQNSPEYLEEVLPMNMLLRYCFIVEACHSLPVPLSPWRHTEVLRTHPHCGRALHCKWLVQHAMGVAALPRGTH